MTTDDVIEALGGWEGYSIENMEVHEEEGRSEVWIELTPLAGTGRCCSGCGRTVHQVHDGNAMDDRLPPELQLQRDLHQAADQDHPQGDETGFGTQGGRGDQLTRSHH